MPMAGYSGTPLPKKLGIREGARIALVGAPETFLETLGELPAAARIVAATGGALDVIVSFSTRLAEIAPRFLDLKPLLAYSGGLWMAWPKKSSGVATDLTENPIRDLGLAIGLVDNKVCAIDETWSALRFVYRLEDRPKK